MSTVGRMDGAFFVSRGELLAWVNNVFRLNLTKVEQCANGAVYCQVIDACHQGAVGMKKVNWGARAEHECIPNFKILQQAFDRTSIQRHIEVDKLIRGKSQDNLEMLQWIKIYFDRTFQGGEYDAVGRRFSDNLPEWARPTEGNVGGGGYAPSPPPAVRRSTTAINRPGGADRGGAAVDRGGIGAVGSQHHRDQHSEQPVRRSKAGHSDVDPNTSVSSQLPRRGDEVERLREEVVDLKITVDGLETERDFYFEKLRDIEILCQALEANPDPRMTVAKFAEDVQRILYAKDDEEGLSREEGSPAGASF